LECSIVDHPGEGNPCEGRFRLKQNAATIEVKQSKVELYTHAFQYTALSGSFLPSI
jgi:hypothetical protein